MKNRIFSTILLMLSFVGVSNAATLTADELSSCEGYPVVLKATDFPAGTKAANLMKSTDGGSTWTAVQSAYDPAGVFTFVDDMGSKACKYKAVSQQDGTETGVVTIALSTNCTAACHTTSSGDYYLGTDFDPEYGHGPEDIDWSTVPPTYLSSHFNDNSIDFKANTGCGGQDIKNWTYSDGVAPSVDRNNIYADTDKDGLPDFWEKDNGLDMYDSSDATNIDPNTGLTYLAAYRQKYDFDGDGLPNDWEEKNRLNPRDPKDANLIADPILGLTYLEKFKKEVSGSNYYYVFSGCSQPFELKFKGSAYHNKYYRFTMKMYVDLTGCSSSDRQQLGNAMMNFRTDYGNDSYNAVDVEIYNDATDILLDKKAFEIKGQLSQDIIGDIFKNNPSVNKFRMDVTMYGQFTGNQGSFGVIPEFQQWRGCMKVAVDYISADVESVCMEHGAVCLGQSTVINAAGFPRNSVYKWEEDILGNGNWTIVNIGGFDMVGKDYQKINLPVNFIGTRKFRVSGSGSIMGQTQTTSVEFNVTGKNCEPLQPAEIEGPANPFCIPNGKEQGKFSVSPLDANPSVTYTWNFRTPSDSVFGSDKISFSGGELDVDTRGGSVYLLLDGNAEEGEYTVTVRPVKTVVYSDGTSHKEPAGDPISKTFTVYKTPRVRIIKEGTDPINQDAVEICPTDDQQKFIVIADPVEGFTSDYMDRYVYTWLTGGKGRKDTADIVIDAEVCSGVTSRHKASLNVQIAEVGCPANVEQTWRYGRHEAPTINCSSLSAKNIVLGPTESKTTVSLLPLPSYKVGCESNPRIKVNLEFTPDGGEKITKEISIREKDIPTTDFNVTLAAGSGTITYTVADGCGLEAQCSIVLTVKDNTPPDVDCDEIKPVTAHLTYYQKDGEEAICVADPSFAAGDMPKLTIPTLTDRNGVDGAIVGEYLGRLMSTTQPPYATAAQRSAFKRTGTAPEYDLNDFYSVGNTWILWGFKDKSDNYSYCIQKVTVIDDIPPVVDCKSLPADMLIGTQPDSCGLSMQGLLDTLLAHNYAIPTAKDVCSGAAVAVKQEVFFKEEGGTLRIVEKSQWNNIIFVPKVKYTVVWRFYKNGNDAIYNDCSIEFTVEDQEAPKFDCSSLSVVRVTANSFKPKDKPYVYLKYASKDDVMVGPDSYKGTLKPYFDDASIKMLPSSAVTDNCTPDVKITAVLSGPDEKGDNRELTIKSTSDLEKLKYGIGLTTIVFTFTDDEGNESSCSQYIMVTSGPTPVPECSVIYDTLYVDETCRASLSIDKNDVPKAKIPVNMEGYYFNFQYSAVAGLHVGQLTGPSHTGDVCQDMAVYFPDKIKTLNGTNKYKSYTYPVPGFPPTNVTVDLTPETFCQWTENLDAYKDVNKWDNFLVKGTPGPGAIPYSGNIIEPANTYTDLKNFDGYPFRIVLTNVATGQQTIVENPYTVEDIVPTKMIVPRRFDGSGRVVATDPKCADLAHYCGEKPVKIQNNFDAIAFAVDTLTRGVYQLSFDFQDTKDGSHTASCIHVITVLDTIKPVLDCGNWSKDTTLAANESCQVEMTEVTFVKKPTAADLNAKDNCSTQAELNDRIRVTREVATGILDEEQALTYPLDMGHSRFVYEVSDVSGNKSYCYQDIEVIDTLGPKFDCSTLKPIEIYTGKDACEADPSQLIKNGLVIPIAEQDKCSPTSTGTAGIKASYYRSDSTAAKPLRVFEDPYPFNTPVQIVWTFEDGATPPNKTICYQDIIVLDTLRPIFDCSEIEDTTFKLDPTKCSATKEEIEAFLGTHTANDVCDGPIDGVPHVKLANNTLVPLYSEFKKDTTYHLVWVFEDKSNNIKECDQLLTIKDVTPPDPSDKCPVDPVKNVDATVTCSVNFSDLNLKSAEDMAIIDLCDGKIVPTIVAKIKQNDGSIISYVNDDAITATYPVGTHHVLYIYEDKATNKDTCDITVNVIDKIKPILEDCEVSVNVALTVSDSICSVDPADVKALIVEPKAYDECDDLSANIGITYLKPVVKRYEIDSTVVRNAEGVFVGYKYDTTLVADGVTKMWDEERFPKGVTRLTWIFTDKAGNQDSCSKNVIVYDHTPPYFDCDKIDPDTLRPEAPVGKCEYEFKLLKEDILSGLNYKAYDACAGDSIPGVLTLNGEMELPDSYTMKVGILYKLLWMFKDEDGNATTCPQWILPSHLNPLNVNCDLIPDTIPLIAMEESCEANQDSVIKAIEAPTVQDACELGIVVAVPTFITATDTIEIDLTSQKFYTGDTTIYWRFVSPWNLHDTAWCSQVVHVAGNKKFDINCETLTPAILDTVDGCDPSTSVLTKIVAPKVADPCADADSDDYWRVGVGTRSDSTALSPMRVFDDPYPLGSTTIRWIFTDFTGSVKDSCDQEVFIRTSSEIKMNCDSLNKDTIKPSYDVPDGVCKVEAGLILNPDTLVAPWAKHPCLDTVKIKVYPRRKGGLSWSDEYIVGVNYIEWVFIDPTHTTVNDSVVCIQPVQVGNSDASLFDCKNIPNKRIELDPADCEITSSDLDFTKDVPETFDACGEYAGQKIDPVWTRTSGKGIDENFTIGYDTIVWKFYYASLDSTVTCPQVVQVLDDKTPNFDCSLLPDTTMASKTGECYLDSANIRAMLKELQEKYYATDACVDSIKIYGQYDESVIPEKLNVGDTINIHWVFQDTTINLQKKECDQMVTVIGDQKPIFNCSSLPHDTVIIEGCDTTLGEQVLPIPVAKDACTGTDVPADMDLSSRLSGNGAIHGQYPVGTETIRWIFKSPYSTAMDTCEQMITVLTKKEIDFNCNTLEDTTFNVAKDSCKTVVTLPRQVGYNPCPEQSGVTEIIGIPSSNGKNFTANADSTEWSMVLPTGVWEIKWTFTDTSNTMANPVKICTQNVTVGDVNEMPVDCKNYPDTLIVLPVNDCSISWDNIGFEAPEVVDLCSRDVIVPTLSRFSGKDMTEDFVVGLDTVYWNYSYAGQDIMCKQAIHVVDSMAPDFDCNSLKPLELVAKKGACEVSAEEIDAILGDTFAIEVCSKEKIWGKKYINGVPVSQVSAHVGDTLKVDWIFKNDSLSAAEKACEQYIYVYGNNQPVFDCASLKDTIFNLRPDQCSLPGSEFTLDIPNAVDSCTHELVPGEASRLDGKSMQDIFELGTTVVNWTFISPHSKDSSKVCPQNVIVKDVTAPIFDCDTMFEDTIKVRVTETSLSETAVSYEEVIAAGFVFKSVVDSCDGVIVGVPSRVDGAAMDADYPLGVIDIVWTFTDKSGNFDTCHQAILVEDYIVPELICPTSWNHKSVMCLDTFPVYGSYEEFVAAGGSFSAPNKLVPNSFYVTEDFAGKQFCDETHYRTYHVKDTRGNDIVCTDTIYVRDTQGPSFNTSLTPSKILTCTDEIPLAQEILIDDNCDPAPVLTANETSTRGTDPSKCDYYNYNIIRTYVAVDRCENRNEMQEVISIVDTIGPKFERPTNWKDTVLATNLKSCTFGVPDLTTDMAKWVKDDCTDNTGITITQNPPYGYKLSSTTVVWITMTDLCQNKDSISKVVKVQDPKVIVSLDASSVDTCVSDEKPFYVSSQSARYAKGYVEIVRSNGNISKISSQFSYDYYKGRESEISDANLIFTDNPMTHPELIKAYEQYGGVDVLRNTMTALNRRSQSSYYTYVAMDTITGCSDTATGYVDIKEVPRISMESGVESVCEFNLLDSATFHSYVQCVDGMGEWITDEGWINRDSIFDLKKDTIYTDYHNSSMVYYATNYCGTTTSLNSLPEFCGSPLQTLEDSMEYVGNDLNKYNLLKQDKLIISDSILLDVHQRYEPSKIHILTEPHDPARIWLGEYVELTLETEYDNYQVVNWYKVVGTYDRENIKGIEHSEFVYVQDSLGLDEEDYLMAVDGYGQKSVLVDTPQDTAKYYVTLSDGVCPSVASELSQVNVIIKLPTAFTPYQREGYNDIFMERHYIVIFDRYGQKVFEGPDGWDGTKDGKLADPGVYYYNVMMTDGSLRKGTIEIVFLNR